jgi:hypothetical protein
VSRIISGLRQPFSCERIFLMKDLAAVEVAVGLGAKIVDKDVAF